MALRLLVYESDVKIPCLISLKSLYTVKPIEHNIRFYIEVAACLLKTDLMLFSNDF